MHQQGLDQEALAAFDHFAQAMSDLDLLAGAAFVTDHCQGPLDSTVPPTNDHTRKDYTLAHDMIEATPLTHFHDLRGSQSSWMNAHARYLLQTTASQHGLPPDTILSGPRESDAIAQIRKASSPVPPHLQPMTRAALSVAFDPISYAPGNQPVLTATWSLPGCLEASVFDRPARLIVLDVAPYVRSIVRYDETLRKERMRLSGLLTRDDKPPAAKRMRTTRSAMSALEGGQRENARRERWFGKAVERAAVEATGGKDWGDVVQRSTVATT